MDTRPWYRRALAALVALADGYLGRPPEAWDGDITHRTPHVEYRHEAGQTCPRCYLPTDADDR